MGKKFNVTDTVYIDRPVEDVYAFVSNYGNDPLWRKDVVEMRLLQDGDLCVGMQMHEVMRTYGQKVVTISEITHLEPNRSAEFRSLSGPIKVRGYRRLEPDGNGTRFTSNLEGDLNPFFTILWPLVGGSFRKDFSGNLQRLKAILEQGK